MTTELQPHIYLPPQATVTAATAVARLLPSQPHRAHRMLLDAIERTPSDHRLYGAMVGAATKLDLGYDSRDVAERLAAGIGGGQ